MKYKMNIDIIFEGENMGFGDKDFNLSDINLMKYLVREEGLFGIMDLTNEELANGIKSVERIKENGEIQEEGD